MPVVIIRPNATTSETGWASSNIHTIIGDNDATTTVDQTSTTCNFEGTLDDLDASLSDATINSMTISLRAVAGRTGTSICTLAYEHPTDGLFGSEAETVTSDTTYTTSARTTDGGAGSALTFAYVNALSVKLQPNTAGVTVAELFVTVDYTAAVVSTPTYDSTVNNIHVTSGNIDVTSGNIFI